MDDAFVFYAYWNGNQIRDLFEGLVSVTNGSGFVQLAAFLVVTGMVACLLIGAVKGEGRSVITYFACAVLFWFVAIVPKATVVIEDVRSQTVYNVDNVPLSMAFFASASSRIGHWLTQAYETAFIPADVAKYSSFGAVYPQRVMEVLQRTGPVTVQGRETLQAVLKNCVLPEVVLDGRKADEAMASSDLWTLIKGDGWVNPARLAVMPDGSVLKCPAAVAELEQVLVNVEIPALKRWVHVKLDPQAVNPSTSIAASITQTESLLLGISRSAESSLKHSLLLTALPKVMSGHAVTVAGPAAMASTLARAQGNLAGEINYRTMAKMAEDALPKIRNALEFVVIAMFPVVALIALVSGSGMAGVVRSYVTLLLTVQLWPALSSVVNYLVIAHDLHPFTLLAQNFGGSSLQAATLIRETGASSQAIAGALLCAVPVISYALVRAGDMAVGQLVGGLTQPAQSAATSQGAAIAAGNISQGNVSVSNVSSNNVSSNKADASIRSVDTGMAVTQSGYGTVTRAASGEVTGLQRTAVSFGVDSQMQQSLVRGHLASNVGQTSTVSTDAARFSFLQSASSSDSTQQSFAHALKDALSEQKSLATNYSDTSGWGNSVTLTRASEMGSTTNASEGSSYATRVGLQVGGNEPFENVNLVPMSNVAPVRFAGQVPSTVTEGVGIVSGVPPQNAQSGQVLRSLSGQLGGALTMTDAQNIVDSATGKISTASGDSVVRNYQMVKAAAEQVAQSHSDEKVRNYARGFMQSLNSTYSASRDQTQSHVESMSAVSTLNESDTGSVTTSADASVPLMNSAVERYGSGEAALRAMYQPAEVASFAGEQHVRAGGAVSPADRFGPGTVVSAVDRNADVFEAGPANVKRIADSNATRIGEISSSTLNASTVGDVMNTGVSEGIEQFDAQHGQFVASHQSSQQTREKQMNFDRGVMLVAREAYNMEHQDKNFALRNAFMGGWGYRNGDQIQEDLRSWAANNPTLNDRLEQIGASDRDYVSESDWEHLVEIARQPKGIRLP